jgi:hypothetical protein
MASGQSGNGSGSEDSTVDARRAWRSKPRPANLRVREFSGWGDAHWAFVYDPGGRVGKMNVTTGEVTVEREDLREDVLRILQHHALESWS